MSIDPPVGGSGGASGVGGATTPPSGTTAPASTTPGTTDSLGTSAPATDPPRTAPPLPGGTDFRNLSSVQLSQLASGFSSTTLRLLALSSTLTDIAVTKDYVDQLRAVETALTALVGENINVSSLFASIGRVSNAGGGPTSPTGTLPGGGTSPPATSPPGTSVGGGGGGLTTPPFGGPQIDLNDLFQRVDLTERVNEDNAQALGLLLGSGLNFFLAGGTLGSDRNQVLSVVAEGNPKNAIGDALVAEKILGFTDSQLRVFTARLLDDLVSLLILPLSLFSQVLESQSSRDTESPLETAVNPGEVQQTDQGNQPTPALLALLTLSRTGNVDLKSLPKFDQTTFENGERLGDAFLQLLGLQPNANNFALTQAVLASLSPNLFTRDNGQTFLDPFAQTLKLTEGVRDRVSQELLQNANVQEATLKEANVQETTRSEAIQRAETLATLITLSTLFAVALGNLNRLASEQAAQAQQDAVQQGIMQEELQDSGRVDESNVQDNRTETVRTDKGNEPPYRFDENTLLGALERTAPELFQPIVDLFDSLANPLMETGEDVVSSILNNEQAGTQNDARHITGFTA